MKPYFVQVTFKLHYLPSSILDALKADTSLIVGVTGSIPQLGSWNPHCVLRSKQTESDVWKVTSNLPVSSTFSWTWKVTTLDGQVMFSDPAGQRETTLSCFSGILETMWELKDSRFISQTSAVRMRIHYHCFPGEVMAVVGSSLSLGAWDPKKAILAKESHPISSKWMAEALLDTTVQLHEWKWVILERNTRKVVKWEDRENRHIYSVSDGLVTMIDTRWCSDLRCELHGSLQELNKYLQKEESSNIDVNWLNNANCIQLPFDVSGEGLANMAAAERVSEPRWQSVIRRFLPLTYNYVVQILGRG